MRQLALALLIGCAARPLPAIDIAPPLPSEPPSETVSDAIVITSWSRLRLAGSERQSLEAILRWLEATPGGSQRSIEVTDSGLTAIQHTPVDRVGQRSDPPSSAAGPVLPTWQRWRATGTFPENPEPLHTVPDETLLLETARRRLHRLARFAAEEGREMTVKTTDDAILVRLDDLTVRFEAGPDRLFRVTADLDADPSASVDVTALSPWTCALDTSPVRCELQTRWDPQTNPGALAGVGLVRAMEVLQRLERED